MQTEESNIKDLCVEVGEGGKNSTWGGGIALQSPIFLCAVPICFSGVNSSVRSWEGTRVVYPAGELLVGCAGRLVVIFTC